VADNPYAPSNLGGAAPPPNYTPTYAPSPLPGAPSTGVYQPSFSVKQALVNAGATPTEATTLTAISGAESNFGKSPISPPNKNGSRDYGYFQINDAAHPQMGGAAVAKMPLDQQAALALQIARSPEGFRAWTTYKNGAYRAHLGQDGSNPAPPIAGSAAPPPPPANVGTALAALSAPTGGPGTKSTIDNLQSTFAGGGGDSAPPPMNLEGQQAASAMGNARQAQIAALAPQLMMATRQMGGLQGVRGAPSLGSTMSYQGGQTMPMATPTPTPGTTLNSTGGLYG